MFSMPKDQIDYDLMDGIRNALELFGASGADGCAIAWLQGGLALASEPYVDEDGWYAIASVDGAYADMDGACRPVFLLEGDEDEGLPYVEDAVEAVNALGDVVGLLGEDERAGFFSVL